MISEFGKTIRKIRNIRGDSLRGLAIKLDVSAAFLSAMEVGRKTIPLEYVEKIAKVYDLKDEEKDSLRDSIYETNNNVSLELSKMDENQKELTLIFARKIENANPDLIKKLKEVLESDKN